MKVANSRQTKLKAKQIIHIVMIVLLLTTLLFTSFACMSKDRKTTAWVCAQQVVEDRLKSPSTAKFPAYRDSYVTDLGNDKYRIKAYVDSQNGFGATIRTNFTVTLTLTEHGFKDYSVVFA